MKFSIVRIVLLSTIAMSLYNLSSAQSLSDNALLFSRTAPGGSARVQALGGAQTAIGGDYSSALSNPAGLGMFNHSEITFSPGLNVQNATSNYSGNSNSTSNTVFNIPGLSLIIHPAPTKTSGFLGGSFGVTVNRTNDLNQSYFYQGKNSNSSLVDYFIDKSYDPSTNQPLDPNSMVYNSNTGGGANFYSTTALGYNNYLTDYDSASNNYYSPLTPLKNETRTELQKETSSRKGAQYQVSIAYGGNFSDKVFFGLSVGLTSIRSTLSQSFTESNYSFSTDPTYNPLNNFRVDETYSIRGSGINLTAGLIYRPVNVVQFGASIVTPTYYQITDTYNATVSSTWNHFDYYGNGQYLDNLQPVSFDQPSVLNYSLTTPFRFNAGATFFIGKYGFITGDAEFVNYSSAKYSDTSLSGVSYDYDNSQIKSNLSPRAVINYRVGGEFRYELFRARLGYNLLPDPYRVSSNYDRKIQNFTGGVGIKNKKYSLDLTAVYRLSNDIRIPYSTNGISEPKISFPDPVSQLKFSNLNFVVTVGFIF